MALAALSAGTNFSSFDLPSDFFEGKTGNGKLPQTPTLKDIPEQSSRVLGAATDIVTEFFKNIPIQVWIILGISILAAIIIGITITLVIREWARGALVASINDIEDQKSISLSNGSQRGIAVTKRLIILHVVPGFIFTLGMIIIFASFIILFLLTKNALARTLIAFIGGLVGVVGILIGSIILSFTVILAQQLIVRRNLSVKEALKVGYLLAKKYFFQMIGMGAIHLGLGCAVGCVTMLLVLILTSIVALAFIIGKQLGFVVLFVIVIPVILIILSSLLIRGIIEVFKTSNWTILIREIETLEEKPQKLQSQDAK